MLEGIRNSKGDTYHVYHSRLDTEIHGGLPQHRPRIYVAGIQAKHDTGDFRWPDPVPSCSLRHVISSSQSSSSELKPSQRNRISNLVKANLAIAAKGLDMWKTDAIVDVDQGRKKAAFMIDRCPCITSGRARSLGYFSTKRLRKLCLDDLIRLQGSNPDFIRQSGLSDAKLGSIVGNAMTISVVQRVLKALLPAAGFVI